MNFLVISIFEGIKYRIMKKVVMLIVSVLTFSNVLIAQEAFYGEWHMQEMTIETKEKKDVTTNEMLKDKGTFWIMRFSKDKFYQKSNDNDEARVDEMEGTWKTEPNDLLTIFLYMNGRKRPLQFYYEFKDDQMILERYNQMKTMRMVVVFKKMK